MLKKKLANAYQFKVTLEEIKPKIWRRIQVLGNATLMDLHTAIQDAFGWQDYHLYQFTITSPRTGLTERFGVPDDEYEDDTLDAAETLMSMYFSHSNKKAMYEYDFGDCWVHNVLLEKILPAEDGVKYPRCIDGMRACPPEDCGSVDGYYRLLRIIKNRKHPEHEAMIQWVGGKFDPEGFNVQSVKMRSIKKYKLR